MKRFIVAFILSVAGSTLAQLPYVGELPQFKVNNPTILWGAPTNKLGASLWIYKVAPQVFPFKAINHVLELGGFTNRVKVSQAMSIGNSSNTCQLVIIPEQGYVRYWDGFAEANHWDRTNHLWETVKGLPSQSDIEKLGLKFMKQWNIRRDELAQTNGHLITFGENTKRSYYDRRTAKFVSDEIKSRGIFFIRRLDGVNFLGIGVGAGCEIEFANNAKVSQFNLIWRNYQPYERYKVATPEQIKQSILEGKTILTKKNFVVSTDVKTVTIDEVIPAYIGADEFEHQEYLYPFARIEATANMGTNKVGIELYCPILSTNLVK